MQTVIWTKMVLWLWRLPCHRGQVDITKVSMPCCFAACAWGSSTTPRCGASTEEEWQRRQSINVTSHLINQSNTQTIWISKVGFSIFQASPLGFICRTRVNLQPVVFLQQSARVCAKLVANRARAVLFERCRLYCRICAFASAFATAQDTIHNHPSTFYGNFDLLRKECWVSASE